MEIPEILKLNQLAYDHNEKVKEQIEDAKSRR